jgi:triacylglycerol esterase/lipase EstA (alpha/beta hydrolase family)
LSAENKSKAKQNRFSKKIKKRFKKVLTRVSKNDILKKSSEKTAKEPRQLNSVKYFEKKQKETKRLN